MTRRQFLLASAAAALCPTAAVAATKFPAKAVRIVVPNAPGGAADITARAVGEHMARTLGQTEPQAEVQVVVPDVTYNVGDHVRVKSGPFANFTGEVEDVDRDKRKVKMSVSIFGRPTPVTVDFAEVEPVAS